MATKELIKDAEHWASKLRAYARRAEDLRAPDLLEQLCEALRLEHARHLDVLQDRDNLRGMESMDTKETPSLPKTYHLDPMTWTPDRPTKPGKYWLSVHPDSRGILFEAGVYEVVLWAADQKVRHVGGLTIVPEDRLIGAQWHPYVEPPDPFAEPVPPSEFKAYRLSDDAKTPNLRLILDVVPGMVTLYEADMTSRRAEAQETEVHDKILMSPADTRWLRDTLNGADLSDPPVERSGRREVKPNGRRRWRKWAKRWRRGQTLARADAILRRAKSIPLPGLRGDSK